MTHASSGWTLIEMVVTLVLLSLVTLLLMVSLKSPLDALTYFKRSYASTEPMVWVDQALKQAFKESKTVDIKEGVLQVNTQQGTQYAFECNRQHQVLTQTMVIQNQAYKGELLRQVTCHFSEQALAHGTQIRLTLSLNDSLGQGLRIHRLFYAHS